MSNDPWKHRSSGMKCKTCMWFVVKDKHESLPKGEDAIFAPSPVGRCRRHAPTMNGYPVVFETDWCGDHKLNEEAL